MQKGRKQPADDGRHFGLVVEDKEAVRSALEAAGVAVLGGRFLDFRDPWGNRIEIVGYDNIQFTKAPNVLRGMGLTHLSKNASATEGAGRKGHGGQLMTILRRYVANATWPAFNAVDRHPRENGDPGGMGPRFPRDDNSSRDLLQNRTILPQGNRVRAASCGTGPWCVAMPPAPQRRAG